MIFGLLLSWAPVILMTLFAFGFALAISKRKRVHWAVCLQVLVPIWGYFFLYWLVSRPDADLLRRIEALEAEQTFK